MTQCAVKDAGSWKSATPFVKDGGTWKTVTAAFVKDGGTWKQFFSSVPNYDDITISAWKKGNAAGNTPATVSFSDLFPDDGDYILVAVVSNSSGSLVNLAPTTSGYTNIYSLTTGDPAAGIWIKPWDGSETSVALFTNTGHAGRSAYAVCLVRGADASNFLDAAVATNIGSSGDPDTNAVTTVTEKALVMSFGFVDDDTAVITTAPTGYTIGTLTATAGGANNSSDSSIVAAGKIVATPSAENPGGWDLTSTDNWSGATVPIRPRVKPTPTWPAGSTRYVRWTFTGFVDATYLCIGEMELRNSGADVLPTFHDYAKMGITVTASHDRQQITFGYAWMSFDGQVGDASNRHWQILSRASTEWIMLDFGAYGIDISAIEDYRIAPRGADGDLYAPTAWTLEYSVDGSSWSTLDTQTGQTQGTWAPGTYRTFTV